MGFAAKLLGGAPCYPIGTLVELLIPIGPLLHIVLLKPIRGPQRRPRIVFACSHKSIRVWMRSLDSGFTVVSNNYLILIIIFNLNRWEMATASEKHLRNPETSQKI